ncbi:inosine triphosphate pyrophosphatase [Mitosporidium daphniae]|uniref:Inosine triphosphate pyrophosphatase n=1 Tax=Mitosporidium daphniae TaxID=1485682 RepID=A0A098VXI0_9MICR|nr:inosine triphosphate pyrophosphatase [Mitosporidium daphniae]KGG52436.1 inosine triphosphate pyrophosphatase [Mitosporidium daphniae]|eukprot:XP_013238872.1 inosine triphosphate pyrophosphatase [Mitosporidium daphniae]
MVPLGERARRLLDGFATRSAEAISTFAYCFSAEQEPLIFQGRCRGKIALSPKGITSFGWDSIFIPDESDDKSFAELTKEQKNKISHRSKALELLKQHFKT